jgi:polyhydroxybutyrate depolymerase
MDDNLIRHTLTIGGLARTFTLRLPEPRSDGSTPLILVLHGNLSSAGAQYASAGGEMMRTGTSFDDRAGTEGVAVAYPDGHGGDWADGRGVTTSDRAGIDDVTFLRTLIEWSAQQHGTGQDRNIVAGISNGAFMAHRMALEAGDLIAAFGAVAGALPEAHLAITPRHAVSALLINGTGDPLVKPAGGYSRHRGPNGERRGRILSQGETTAFWQTVNRCAHDEAATTTPPSDEPGMLGLTQHLATEGAGGSRVATWTLHGGGHTWPGMAVTEKMDREFLDRVGPIAQNFDAAEEICRFALPLLAPADARRL